MIRVSAGGFFVAKYYRCDMCGVRIASEDLRYVLNMSIFAAYDKMEIELSDLEKDYEEEIRKLTEKMEHMDPKQLQEDVFKQFNFDLCRACQQKLLANPLGSGPAEQEPSSDLPPFDVDDFLRQLGSG